MGRRTCVVDFSAGLDEFGHAHAEDVGLGRLLRRRLPSGLSCHREGGDSR